MPATYAAIRTALDAARAAFPGFAPGSLLDVGAGPDTALWAAAGCWPSLTEARLIEASPVIRDWAIRLLEDTADESGDMPATIEWVLADIRSANLALSADLVTAAYLLDEIDPEQRGELVKRLWASTTGMLVIVEPGTPAGWARIVQARAALIAVGAHVLAPCPHQAACPLHAPDWCHFAVRVARSRLHRRAKGGEVPWEDEKFVYLAAARNAGNPTSARVIAPPRQASGQVTLKLCEQNGAAAEHRFSRRDGDRYKRARRIGWGDAF